ncbi:protein Wnt-6 [Lates japonicus]|uniref:Protein Wnt n=1 Tax=Lates japonicus TaxID=270547 RepID=A0AAD3MRL2_LATJO|nr:protein Wnt-6 [Lates japonicus]
MMLKPPSRTPPKQLDMPWARSSEAPATRTECKCHGLSGLHLGARAGKRCHFREVGDCLLERFQWRFQGDGRQRQDPIPVAQNIKPPDKQDLIYSDESLDARKSENSVATEETVVFEENCSAKFPLVLGKFSAKKCLVRRA